MRSARLFAVATLTSLLTLTAATASAESWDLDLSFSDDGTLRVLESDAVLDVGVVNGRVYAAGVSWDSQERSLLVIRTLADGTYDNSFGSYGVASVNMACDTSGFDFDVLADGSSIASCQSREELRVLKWTEAGVLDTSFSADGIRTVAVPSPKQSFYFGDTGVVIDGQGRVVVGAMADSNDGANARIYRMLPSGALDTSFSSDGIRRLDLYDVDWVDDIAVVARDRIVIASDDANCPNSDEACYKRAKAHLIRLTKEGGFDQSFSDDGVARFSIRSFAVDFSYPIEIGVDSDNVITAALTGTGSFGVARILADGTPDPEYGVEGVVGLTCKCYVGSAHVVNGKVALAGTSAHFDQTLVATISQSGNSIVQGQIDLLPEARPEFSGAVAFDGNAILIGGGTGRTGFINRII